jgi:4-hydroxy-4-methyl-2-oxoglutarate aldolase
VFCRGLSIKGTGKNQPGRVNVATSIGDAVIRPGDIVVADRDGMVVVAQDDVASVIQASLAREAKEAGQRQAIAQELLGLADTLRCLGLDWIRIARC